MHTSNSAFGFVRSAVAAAWLFPFMAITASADITVTESTTFDLAVIKAHGNKVERVSGDKSRTDNELHCEGMMSLLCGNQKSGEIIRLDKDLRWDLEPAKKSYLEKPFPTLDQIAEAKQRMAAMMEKLKSCPQPEARSAPDTSKCEMSPPKFDINKTSDMATLAGHQAQRTAVTMTQSCKSKDTGDSCDLIFAFDTWLTQDDIAGSSDIRSFRSAYYKKLGLDDVRGAVSAQMQQYLAPYADALRQVSAKAGDLKGYPLRTTMRVAMGGEHCAQVAQMRQQNQTGGGSGDVIGNAGSAATSAAAGSTQGAAGSVTDQAVRQATGNSIGGAIAGSAAGAFGSKLIGGLFAKKPAATTTPSAAPSSAPASAVGAQVTFVNITTETTAISSDSISGDQFELPAGWKKLTPKPEKERDVTECPTVAK